MEQIELEVGGFGRGGRRGTRFERDWTKGSIIRNLWSLSWPMTIGSTIRTMGPTIDMIWVGRLGTAAIAGVGVATMAVHLMNSARMGLSTGTRAMVARFVGAGDFEGANHAAQQVLVISVAFSAIMALIGVFLAEPILMLFGLEADVVDQGAPYMRILFVGMVTMSFVMMAEAIMQASGDAVTPMKIAVGTRLFHIALCPFLIFGWWIFPRLGVSGAAVTTIVEQSLGAAVGLWFLFSGRTRLRLTLRNFRLDGNMTWRIVKVGIPASVTGMERSFANLLLTWFVTPFGTIAVAAHSLLQRIDMFIHMPTAGFGMASGVLAGQNLGAGQPERAERTGWLAAGLVTGVMLIASVAIWFCGGGLIRIFNPDPELVEIGSTFLRIEIVSYLVFGLVIVLQHCLNDSGDTLPPMLITLVSMWLVQVPVAYFLSRSTPLGVYGVRWGIVIAMVLRAVIYAAYFKLGRWKRKKV